MNISDPKLFSSWPWMLQYVLAFVTMEYHLYGSVCDCTNGVHFSLVAWHWLYPLYDIWEGQLIIQ